MVLNDAELIKLIQDGDVLAFSRIVAKYQKRLFYFVLGIIRNDSIAEEIVQNSFLKIYKMIDRVDVNKKFSTLLFEIAKNEAFTILKKRKKEVSLSNREFAVPGPSWEEAIEKEENKERVGNAMRRLKPEHRLVLKLYYFQSLSYEEIHQKLDIPLNTVRTYLKRGKEQMKKILAKEKVK